MTQMTPEQMEEIFGPNVNIGSGPAPVGIEATPGRSAKQIGKNYRDGTREQRQAERGERLAGLREQELDRAAYDLVVVQGQTGTAQDQVRADRHARRHDLLPKQTSAQKMAARYTRS
jgi:hypothetical protein